MNGNVAVLTLKRDYYKGLLSNNHFPLRTSNESDVDVFVAQLDDAINDCNMQISRVKLLTVTTSERKTLVRPRSFEIRSCLKMMADMLQILQHMQSQTTEEMKTLSVMSQKEAVAMRIITVVTLLYLPATFVSVGMMCFSPVASAETCQTFFSTDVVKYQNQGGDSSTDANAYPTTFSTTAMYRWLQVTLPLTFLTLLVAWLAYRRANKQNPFELLAQRTTNTIPLLKVATGNL